MSRCRGGLSLNPSARHHFYNSLRLFLKSEKEIETNRIQTELLFRPNDSNKTKQIFNILYNNHHLSSSH